MGSARGRGLQSPLCAQGCVVDPPVEGSCSQAHLDPRSFVHNKLASSLHLSAFSFPLLFASSLGGGGGRRERCPSAYETSCGLLYVSSPIARCVQR